MCIFKKIEIFIKSKYEELKLKNGTTTIFKSATTKIFRSTERASSGDMPKFEGNAQNEVTSIQHGRVCNSETGPSIVSVGTDFVQMPI